MAIQITKDSIDLGIVVRDAAAMLTFYRDTLGLPHVGTLPMGGGAVMERLACGTTVIKLVSWAATPEGANPPGGNRTATGMRYFTISVADLQGVFDACVAAGAPVAVKPVEFRPGVHIAIVEDPDGNWVEFLQNA